MPALERVTVLANDRVAEGVGLIALQAPRVRRERAARPVRAPARRRAAPTSSCAGRSRSTASHGERIEILYQVLGAGTLRLAEKRRGRHVDGPRRPARPRLGACPRASRTRCSSPAASAPRRSACSPSSSPSAASRSPSRRARPRAERLVARELFERVARRVEVATDDGSAGEHGLRDRPGRSACSPRSASTSSTRCGPEADAARGRRAGRRGAACPARSRSSGSWRAASARACRASCRPRDGLKRACVDGPVFDAEEVVWDASQIPPKH